MSERAESGTQIADVRAQARHVGAEMLRRFGPLFGLLGMGLLTRGFRLGDHSVERVRAASDEGAVVYVLQGRSTLDRLALNVVLNQRRLPLPVWVEGFRSRLWRRWRDRPEADPGAPEGDPVRSGWLRGAVAAGAPVVVSVDEPGAWPWGSPGADPLAEVVEALASGTKVSLLPVIVLWHRAPRKEGVLREAVWGSEDNPSLLARARSLVFQRSESVVQVGEPIDLAEALSAAGAEPLEGLRVRLRRRLVREAHVVLGPTLQPRREILRNVLHDPDLRAQGREVAAATGESVAAVESRMAKELDDLAADFRFSVIRMMNVLLRPVWTRVFSGVEVPDADVEVVRAAMRSGTAVLVSSHRSNFDVLLLGWAWFQHDLVLPHIVTGANLRFWPLGPILRRAGGFFVKRSFAGETTFPLVFSRYLTELVRLGHPIEFFIEGGRSRTGRLLAPRVGVLEMVVQAAADRQRGQEVTLLPVALSYEQVAEADGYAREQQGEGKRPESVGQLVAARRFFRSRFGRVQLRVGAPVRCSEWLGDQPWAERPEDERREAVATLGRSLVARIGRVMPVVPLHLVCCALAADAEDRIPHERLRERVERFRGLAARAGAPETEAWADPDRAVGAALDVLLRLEVLALEDEQDPTWRILAERRLLLDFYKNPLGHLFFPAGLAALIQRAGEARRRGPMMERLRDSLATVWIPDPTLDPEALASAGRQELVEQGALDARGRVRATDRLDELVRLVLSPLQGLRVALAEIASLPPEGEPRAALAARVAAAARRRREAGESVDPEVATTTTATEAVEAALHVGALVRGEGKNLVAGPEAGALVELLGHLGV